jgi:transcriptional regulator with XRE-family HTH domain
MTGYHTRWGRPPEQVDDPERIAIRKALAFGKAVYDRRRALGFSITELADRAGMTVDELEGIEEGGTEPSIDMVRRLAAALDSDMHRTAGHDLSSVWFEPRVEEAPEYLLNDEELEALLSAVRDVMPAPARRGFRVEADGVILDFQAAPEDDRFTVSIKVTSISGRPVRADATTIALEVNHEYFITSLAPDGSAMFVHVPAGDWYLRVPYGRRLDRRDSQSLALPSPRPPAKLAAAGRPETSAILTAILLDAHVNLILHREGGDDYLLEVITRTPAEIPQAVVVRYGTVSGGEGLVVIPARPAGLARLSGYSPISPWEASAVRPDEIVTLGVDRVAYSVQAAANNVTRRAWREIEELAPDLRQVIERELAGPS